MLELIAHLWGDYVLQNHWMAVTKKHKLWWGALACLIHATLYTLPFAFLVDWSEPRVAAAKLTLIGSTHYVIDRKQIINRWANFYGAGKLGWLMQRIFGLLRKLAGSSDPAHARFSIPNSMCPDAPPFLGVWLVIIIDNTVHLTINHIVLGL